MSRDVLDRVDVAQLLHLVPAERRRVLQLRYVDGLTQAEVAARLGVAQGTVASTSARALGLIRAMAS